MLFVHDNDSDVCLGFILFSSSLSGICLIHSCSYSKHLLYLFSPLALCVKERDGYWKMMQKYIGSDVTSMVTLPVIIFEPMTMLQKMAEVCLLLVCHC